MPQKATLTKRRIQDLKPPKKGRVYIYDAKTPGLAICVTATGSKTWYCCRKVNGQAIKVRLGGAAELSPEQARTMAIRMAAEIANGVNPARRKQRSREEWTFGQLFAWYIEHHAKVHKKTWEDDQWQFDKYCGRLANRKLSDIDRDLIGRIHAKIGETGPYVANRVLAMLRAAFNQALASGVWKGDNPCTRIRKFKEQSRDRFLQPHELPQLFAALDQEPEVLRDFFLMALLTGARRGNVLAMAWVDIDLQSGIWRIPYSKSGSPIRLPLVGPALELLRLRAANNHDNSPWVFPSNGKKPCESGHLEDPKTAWARVIKRAGIENLRIHDLRRTVGAWQAGMGTSSIIIGRSLGHKDGSPATAVYSRLNIDPVRQSMEGATQALITAGGGLPHGVTNGQG